MRTDEGIEIEGQMCPSLVLWEDTAPKEVMIKCFTDNGVLSFYNIWDKGTGRQSQLHTSGMLISESDNRLIYHCNDIGFDTNFDKLVFSIEKL
ncbi:hypothetical protein WAK64_15315 [Bacillus spongiae]|uniref:Uncharacterized protein n=1 Tax=Bacillus spongiae TaxID=2683610 RepID=A0ABU8HGB9_9BACI